MDIEKTAKNNALILRHKALIENPDSRVPICLVLDASGSMDTVVSGETVTGKIPLRLITADTLFMW